MTRALELITPTPDPVTGEIIWVRTKILFPTLAELQAKAAAGELDPGDLLAEVLDENGDMVDLVDPMPGLGEVLAKLYHAEETDRGDD